MQHSKKPDEVRNAIVELCGDIPRIELFAREKHTGWDCWGNQVLSDVEIYNVQPKNDMQCGEGKNNI